MVSGGGTKAKEAGPRRNRGGRVASSPQGPGAQEESKTVPLTCARREITRYVVGDSLPAGTRWYVFVRKCTGGLRSMLDATFCFLLV